MAYAADKKPLELTALTSLATDDTIIVGDTSDTTEVAKSITVANATTALVTTTAVTTAGAVMDSELTSIADVKALDQSVVSGATPTFTNTNFTEAANKNYVTDAQQTVITNTSGANTGDEVAATDTTAGVIELATDAEMTTGTATDRAITPANAKVELDKKSLIAGSASIVTTGALDSGSITSNFGAIDNGASNITTTGIVAAGNVNPDEIKMAERADHVSTPGAGFGYYWTKNTTPSTPMFTDDAGTDFTINAGGDLVDDTTPVLGGDLDTSTFDIILGDSTTDTSSILLNDSALADEKWSGTTILATAGATISVGDLCYLKTADGEWYPTDGILDGTDTAFALKLGICVDASTDGAVTEMLLDGVIASAAFPAFTVGAPVYMDDTAGDMVVAQPSTTNFAIRIVGYAVSATVLHFSPDNSYIVHV